MYAGCIISGCEELLGSVSVRVGSVWLFGSAQLGSARFELSCADCFGLIDAVRLVSAGFKFMIIKL